MPTLRFEFHNGKSQKFWTSHQIGITLDIYSHVLPTMGLAAAGKLAPLLAKKPARKKRAAVVA